MRQSYGRTHMTDDEADALRDVESTQQALRRNIEQSTRLIGEAEDAIQRYREKRERQPANDGR